MINGQGASVRLRTWAGAAALGLLALAGGGCMTVIPAGTRGRLVTPAVGEVQGGEVASMRESPGSPWTRRDAWPARWRVTSGLRRDTVIQHGRPPMGIIERVEGPLGAARRGEDAEKKVEEELAADVNMLAARHRSAGGSETITVRGEGPGSFVFSPSKDRSAWRIWENAAGKPAMYMKFISAEDAPGDVSRSPDVQGRLLLIQRTWWAVYEPIEAAPMHRGTIVLLPGMFGAPKETTDLLVGVLRRHGWYVVRMLAHPSRFTEQKSVAITAETVEASAALIAAELVDRAAECAYAAEAALMLAEQERPEMRTLPRVALGMSGGAMVLPQVVAREPARYAGAVLVAGGVNYLRILLDSNYTDWIDALRLNMPRGDAGRAIRQGLVAAYDRIASLDSERCVECLKGKPLLVLHASSDQAVPAAQGERMWELLERPERWVVSGGHEMLFLVLPSHYERMIKWLNDSVGAQSPVPAPVLPVGER